MKKFVLALAATAFAAVLATGVAYADDGSSNNNSQSATLVQSGSSSATATNNGIGEAESKSISSNDAVVDQSSTQIAHQGSNTNSQSVTSVQDATSSSTAENDGYGLAESKAISTNDLGVDQYVKQLAFGYCGVCGGASNTNSQTVVGVQTAAATALATNLGAWEADAFAGTFNDAWVTSCIFQLAAAGLAA